ncbi:hypothetical protein [Craterilacuibacter sp. RT1T]|uniref:hypothetical protein n=1 Tax=Craterilacuibacter sp. RT1T TaxID=2942211 RepID=UPI0020BFC6AD|nr:hypothetical protein [Craterilacuibacter sp. RT1T]MCL6262154.1 hypothetical protein [Craterilacuibacter sp. RT1T]
MNTTFFSSLKKLAEASEKADALLTQGAKEVFDVLEARTRAHEAERENIKGNHARGARLSKHRFTL